MLKQTLIIKQIDSSFSRGKGAINGIAKFACENTTTHIEIRVNNINSKACAQWVIALQCGNAHFLVTDSISAYSHTIIDNKIDRISLLICANKDTLYPVAYASNYLNDYDNRLLLLAKEQDYSQNSTQYSQYEKFIIATDNYYANHSNLIAEYRSALDTFYRNATADYFVQVKQYLIDLFDNFPAYPPLIQLIDNSYWIRIQRKNSFFCLGILTKNNAPTHICYAMPLVKAVSPNLHDYHIIYQSATDGKLTTDYHI